ncbi:hypothetical protein [Nitrospina gracilis]|uniref:hypothetical protein n=1 Tax=Nitrospina gracilis TaxID=35801 RepID=UPI001F31F326|nr:hypothetical protein [Nitrospina gracilis]MCF8719338.1 nitrate/TMAO reductase-like tetraheme cytochrome c subunit [Nitrospina gracilis Nb-211]
MMRTGRSNSIAAALMTVLIFSLPMASRAATVPQENNSCITCHGGLDDERLSHPVALWTDSVHAKVGNTCDGCHGGDPKDLTLEAMSKSKGFHGVPPQAQVTDVCAKCHSQTAESYKSSAHFQVGQPTCIDCHNPHAIERTAAGIVTAERCSLCHEFTPAEKLKTILTGLSERLQETRQRIAAIRGFPMQSFEQQHTDASTELQNVRRVSHSLDLEKVQEGARNTSKKLRTLTEDIARLENVSQDRRRLGLIAIALFLTLTVITYLYNEQNKKDEGTGD